MSVAAISPWAAKRYEDALRRIAENSQDETARSLAEQALAPDTTYALRHVYKPHRKYPWFCRVCGYPEHESLKHA